MDKLPGNNRLLKISIVIISLLFISSSLILFESIGKIKQQEKIISNLTDQAEVQKEKISQLETSVVNLEQNLSSKEESLKNETRAEQKLEMELINLTAVARVQYGLLAVDENNVGHLIPVEVIIKNGSGNLFLNVANVLVDETLQSSVQTAVHVARDIARKSLSDKDVLINIESPAETRGVVVSGESAGGAITLATIAALEGKMIKNKVLMTGTINEDHSIGRIGAPREKALAAKENGAVMFLVPAGQKIEVGDVGIEVREVATIEDAESLAISS
ncbi:Lon protease [uncultured archaeon]|nr:Lon protease [uncultured archaeon]